MLRILRKIDRIEEFIAGFCIFLIPIILFLQLVFRALDFGFPWFEEVLRFSFLLLVYSASVIGVKYEAHFSLTFLTERLPIKWSIIADVVKYITWYTLNIIIIYQSTIYILKLTERPQTSPVLEINMAWIYMIIPIAFVLQTIRLTQVIVSKILKK